MKLRSDSAQHIVDCAIQNASTNYRRIIGFTVQLFVAEGRIVEFRNMYCRSYTTPPEGMGARAIGSSSDFFFRFAKDILRSISWYGDHGSLGTREF